MTQGTVQKAPHAPRRVRIVSAWEQFWFREVRSDVFALVRIAIGGAGLIDLLGLIPVSTFWSPDGLAPLPGGGVGLRAFVLNAGLGEAAGWMVFGVLFLSFTCMVAGLFTGAAVTACFLGSVFQRYWNPLPLNAAHTVLTAVLFCLVWADCGQRLSLDAWRTRHRQTAAALYQPMWPLRLIRVQVAIVYASSGIFKLLEDTWRNGSAVHYAAANNIYGRVFHAYAPPPGLEWMFTLLTYSTVAWELSFVLLLLNRITRPVALAVGAAFHIGIWATMEVGSFSLMMLATYVAFLDPDRAARLVDAWLPISASVAAPPAVEGAAQPM